jgi:DNA-binding NtrC family response regulator
MTYTPRTPKGRLATALCDTTRAMITAELEALRGNRSEAARRLGISRRALIYKMQELGIDIPASHGNGYTAAKRAVSEVSP